MSALCLRNRGFESITNFIKQNVLLHACRLSLPSSLHDHSPHSSFADAFAVFSFSAARRSGSERYLTSCRRRGYHSGQRCRRKHTEQKKTGWGDLGWQWKRVGCFGTWWNSFMLTWPCVNVTKKNPASNLCFLVGFLTLILKVHLIFI